MGFVALADSECQKVLNSVLLIGSYSDFVKTLPFVLKNYEIESYAVNVMMYNYIHLIRSEPEGLKKYFLESALDNGLSREGDELKGPKVFLDLNEEDKNFLNRFLESFDFRNQLALEIKSIVPETFAKETSPAFFTDRFYRPCFLLHGDDDSVISPQESKDLRNLLLKNGNQKIYFLETSLLTHGDHRPFYSGLNEILPMAKFWGEYLNSVDLLL